MNNASATQEEVFAFLGAGDPAGGPVQRIDTHAAAVFLFGERVLKVKRAVRFPFLDFSTLAKRRAACASELEVNRPFSSGLYRRIVPITREPDGRLRLDGTGEPVEWAVEMRRFDETRTLDRLADRGEIDLDLADALGRTVAAAHAASPVVQAAPWIAALATYVEQNDVEFGAAPDVFDPAAVAMFRDTCKEALARLAPLLAARGKAGLVRRGHGDLHLGNIALIDGRPVAFDALEFDPLIASGDVLYDLAFLLMDLIERGLTAAANIVLNRYLWQTRRLADLDGLAALPLFMALRAAIRAKVTAARRAQVSHGREGLTQTAQTYFRLAIAFLSPAPPRLVAVGGLSGTGKSALARALAPHLSPAPGAVVLRSDIERKHLFGLDELQRLPQDAYSRETTGRVYAVLVDKAQRAIAAGHSVIVDAVFARPDERAAIAQAAHGQVPFTGLFLTADLERRIARVGARVADASDADAGVVRSQSTYDVGPLDWTVVDANGSPDTILAFARDALAGPSDPT